MNKKVVEEIANKFQKIHEKAVSEEVAWGYVLGVRKIRDAQLLRIVELLRMDCSNDLIKEASEEADLWVQSAVDFLHEFNVVYKGS